MNPYLAPSAADCAEPRAAAGSQDTLTQAPAVAAAEPVTSVRLTGGAALARAVRTLHDGPLFGMAGFQFATYYEAMRALGMSHWLINDERSAMFAADAWARVTNRPAVVDGTLGPGATNLVSGLVESLNAGIPAVVLVGDAHRQHAGKNMTQEGRQVEILRPAVKELLRVEHIRRIPELVGRAFDLACRGRPGPVAIDVPEDIAHDSWDFEFAEFDALVGRGRPLRSRPDPLALQDAAALLARAKRPVLLAGGGIHLSGAHAALAEFARAQCMPVAHTLSGKGAIACRDPLSLGVFGRYSRVANDFITRSDCLVVVGCKLGEIATRRYTLLPAGVPVIQIDIEAGEFGRTGVHSVALWADAAAGLADLGQVCRPDEVMLQARRAQLDEAQAQHVEWRAAASQRIDSEAAPVNVARLLRGINEVLPDDGIVIADGGFAAHWSGLFLDTKRAGRAFVANRGFASIGYGLPAALGAQLAAGVRRVVALTGDGGLNMSLGELETARRMQLPFVLVVLNNAASGYVKAMQHAMFGPGHYQSSELSEIDYAALARAVGCHGIRVERPEQIEAALREALAHSGGPTLLDVVVTRDPAQMLPGIDERGLAMKAGDRPI